MNAVRELRDVLDAMQRLDGAAEAYALATIIGVEGSTYRLPGARQLVPASGTSVGTVSGGCLEGEVEAAARRVIEDGTPQVHVYDLTADDDLVWGWGLGCNGITTVLFEPATTAREAAAVIAATLDGTEPVVLVTDVATAQRMTVRRDGSTSGTLGSTRVDAEAAVAAALAIDSTTSSRMSVSDVDRTLDLFIEVLRPAPRLIVCGTGRDTQPLVAQAAGLGFDVYVADERPGALTNERFPDAAGFLVGPPSIVREAVEPGRDTYVMLMSHNFLRDGDYLGALCGTGAAYIGLLGPKERSEKLIEYVRDNGVEPTDADLAVMYGPAGLDIGADGPQEIAWAILAEILAVRAGGPPVTSAIVPSRFTPNMSEVRVGGIVLAAGAATRMGQPKQNLGFGNTTLVGFTIRNAEESTLDDVVVVTGAHELEELVLGRARLVHNPDHADGSVTSLLTGIDALGDVDAAVVLLGDSPEIDPPIIDTVVSDWRKFHPWAAVAEYHDGVGHPYVLSKAVFPLLVGLSGDKALFPFLVEHSEEVRRVMVPQLKPQDINTWQDYVEAHVSFGFGTPQED